MSTQWDKFWGFVAAGSLVLMVGCGSEEATGSPAATGATGANPPASVTEPAGATVTTEGQTESSPAPGNGDLSPDLLAGASAGAAVLRPVGDNFDLGDCPLVDPVMVANAAGITSTFNDFDNNASPSGVRCIARVADSDPFTAVSTDLRYDVDQQREYLSSASWLTEPTTTPLTGGELVTECPDETDANPAGPHCEAFWFAPDGTYVLGFDYTGAGSTAALAGEALSGMLAEMLAELAG